MATSTTGGLPQSDALGDLILRVLVAAPRPLRASEIADRLNRQGRAATKAEVNSCLYGELAEKVIQNSKYAWTLVGSESGSDDSSSGNEPAEVVGSWSRFQRVASYYADCVREDEGSLIRSFLTDEGKTFISFNGEAEWIGSERDGYSVELGHDSQFLKLLRQSRDRGTLAYGYPLYVEWINQSRSGWTGGFAIPVFLQSLDFAFVGNRITFSLENNWPRVNPAFLEKAFRSRQEREDFLDRLGLLMPDGPPPEGGLSEVALRMKTVASGLKGIPELNPSRLVRHPPIASIDEGGLHNRAIIAATEPAKFTAGLLRELDLLSSKVQSPQLDRSSLRVFFDSQSDDYDPEPIALEDIDEVVPLNEEQRAAVASALTNPITVVTGPPGTGKSQVVTNILANAYLNGQSVLFTSRNNKAVDVVEQRLNSLAAVPLMVRAGTRAGERDLRAELSQHITSLLSTSATASDRNNLEQAQAAASLTKARRGHVESKIEQVREARNRHEMLDATLSDLREGLRLDNECLLRDRDNGGSSTTLRQLLDELDAHLKAPDGWFSHLWSRVSPGSRERKLIKALGRATEIGLNPVPAIEDEDLESKLIELRDQVALLLELRGLEPEVNSARETLTGMPELVGLAEELSAADTAVWDAGTRLIAAQARQISDRLDPVARQALAAYKGTLDELKGRQLGGRRYAKLRQQQEALFSKLLSFIPLWCVTNLSAGGAIPFKDSLFDILVIDEASQCDIPSAIPLMYRAKRIVVIGDPMQLSHISSISSSRDEVLRNQYDLLEAEDLSIAYDKNSLFDFATAHASSARIINLLEHFRSHVDIIEFSNRQWYQGRLRIATDYRRLNQPGGPAVRWTDVVGRARRPGGSGAINEIEASEAVKQVVALMRSGFSGSIGVITPFRAQANRIRDLVNKAVSIRDIEQFKLIVDTAHGFQGDERDVIFFSPVVASGFPDGGRAFLSRTGNLFNVAVTRARSVLHVVGDQEACANSGIPHVEGFARYCEGLNEESSGRSFEPEMGFWEKPLQEALEKAGLKPVPQFPVNQYRLDLAFPDAPVPLDIEVDGELYHKELDGSRCREDVLRDMRMMALGWKVLRFWVYEVRDDMDRCVEEIQAALLENDPDAVDGRVRDRAP